MRPVSLRLEGFGGFRSSTTVDFDDLELIALVGKTGSGKSTIIDAVTFALYGMVSRYDDGRKVHPVINSLSNEAKVQFAFESGGVGYQATRVIRRTKTGASTKEARLQTQETVLADGAKEVTTALEGILGLDFDQFTKVVVLPQGRFSAFLRDSVKNRRTMLAETLGISRYDAIGRSAREIAKASSIQAAEKRTTLTRFETRTGDVNAVQRQLDDLQKLSVSVDQAAALITRLTVQRGELEQLHLDAVRAVERLEMISTPSSVLDLDQRISEAQKSVDEAARKLEQLGTDREDAIAAVRNGPDIQRSERLLSDYETLSSFTSQLQDVDAELQQATAKFTEATELQAGYEEKLELVERELVEAEAQEAEYKRQAADGPNLDGLDLVRSRRQEFNQLQAKLGEYQNGIDSVETAVAEAASALQKAETQAKVAEDDYKRIVDVERGAALRHSLVVGEPCPVCDSPVDALPRTELAHNLAERDKERKMTYAAARKCEAGLAALQQRSFEQLAAKEATESRVAELRSLVSDTPTETEIEALERVVAENGKYVNDASKRREELAKSARDFRANDAYKHAERQLKRATVSLQKLETKQAALVGQSGLIKSRLDSAPTQEELRAAIISAKELNETAERASKVYADSEQLQSKLLASVAALHDESAQQKNELFSVRDGVGHFKPPAPTNGSLLQDWDVLSNWAVTQVASQNRQIKDIDAKLVKIDSELAHELDAAKSLVAGSRSASNLKLGVASTEQDPSASVRHIEQSIAAAISSLTGQRELLAVQGEQVTQLEAELVEVEERQHVYEMLGEQLKASNFGDWLLSEIVEALALRASERLYELSAGHFSLAANELNFEVIDHTNGDSRRDARTLSGGETFLASLALALALADGIVEMSSSITSPLESLFLDEGFGTLDDDYLDIVASAVEDLGAQGRMVVVITHIDELAERLPTRFELTKTQGSSSVNRVDQ